MTELVDVSICCLDAVEDGDCATCGRRIEPSERVPEVSR